MRKIKLTQGKYAIIDDEDFELISKHRWHIKKDNNDLCYAMTTTYPKNGKQKSLLMHRLILNTSRSQVVDHINRDGLDNRRSNLRICTRAQNMQNRIAAKNGTSEFKGVHLYKATKMWRAQIQHNGKKWHLGQFASEEEAACVYTLLAQELHGKFARVEKAIEEKDHE